MTFEKHVCFFLISCNNVDLLIRQLFQITYTQIRYVTYLFTTYY